MTKYVKRNSKFYKMLGLCALLFRTPPRRTSTLARLFFRNNKAPRTVSQNDDENYLLRTKKSKWFLFIKYYKKSAKQNIIRDFPIRSPNGTQIIKITDQTTRQILSKVVKKVSHEEPIFGNAKEMLSLLKEYTGNPKITLRVVRRLAINDFYERLWQNNHADSDDQNLKEFVFSMGHTERTSKNVYLTEKDVVKNMFDAVNKNCQIRAPINLPRRLFLPDVIPLIEVSHTAYPSRHS